MLNVLTFLYVSHTIEDVQNFANTRIPAPPSVRVVKLLVPRSCCDEAATLIIKALGGEENTKRIVGGVKWWQVRGINGYAVFTIVPIGVSLVRRVEAQWITAKKDWREAKKRQKLYEKLKEDIALNDTPEETAHYEKEMDAMRCILYLHGGMPFHFPGHRPQRLSREQGATTLAVSINTGNNTVNACLRCVSDLHLRYSMQRHARKTNGRVLGKHLSIACQAHIYLRSE